MNEIIVGSDVLIRTLHWLFERMQKEYAKKKKPENHENHYHRITLLEFPRVDTSKDSILVFFLLVESDQIYHEYNKMTFKLISKRKKAHLRNITNTGSFLQ
jgi:hypothetical protein